VANEREGNFKIGDVVARTGLTARAIRYYEELGLITLSARTEGEFRLYSEAEVTALLDISRLRDLLGFSLQEVRETIEAEHVLQSIRERYVLEETSGDRIRLVETAYTILENQISLIQSKRDQLEELLTDKRTFRDRVLQRLKDMGGNLGDNNNPPSS